MVIQSYWVFPERFKAVVKYSKSSKNEVFIRKDMNEERERKRCEKLGNNIMNTKAVLQIPLLHVYSLYIQIFCCKVT
jgi:hypothetical protein